MLSPCSRSKISLLSSAESPASFFSVLFNKVEILTNCSFDLCRVSTYFAAVIPTSRCRSSLLLRYTNTSSRSLFVTSLSLLMLSMASFNIWSTFFSTYRSPRSHLTLKSLYLFLILLRELTICLVLRPVISLMYK